MHVGLKVEVDATLFFCCLVHFISPLTQFWEKTQKKKPQTGTETNLHNFYFSQPSVEISVQTCPTFQETNEVWSEILEVTTGLQTADCVYKTVISGEMMKWEKQKEEHNIFYHQGGAAWHFLLSYNTVTQLFLLFLFLLWHWSSSSELREK